MARQFDFYDDKNQPMKCFMTNARWYKESETFTPLGILLHDTAADNPWLKRYVQPDDNAPDREEMLALIGKNPYGNDRNHGAKDVASGLNAWIGKLANGNVTTLQTGPWNKRPWGCGSYKHGSSSYSLNDTHIQWEMCQDAKKDAAYFGDCYEESVQLSAYLCKMFNIDPNGIINYRGIKVPTIVCHWDSYSLKCGGDHSDIYDWTAMYEYLGIPRNKVNINDPYNNPINLRIREDIAKAMNRGPERNGWVKENGKWYYYSDNVMLTSAWVKWRGDFYYVGADGVMVTGWNKINDKDYFFHDSGICAQDEWITKDKAYLFLGMDGAQTYRHKGSWNEDSKGKWFEDTSGWYAKSRSILIDGKEYSFNKDGYLI